MSKEIKITKYQDLEALINIKDLIIINLEDCPLNERKRVIAFLSGLASKNASLKKISKDKFEILN